MLDFIAVFNPKYCTDESDSDKQLLLYHSFQGEQSYSLNDKLSQIGIIQAVWTFSKSFEASVGVSQSVLQLDQQMICTIQCEDDFFFSTAISNSGQEEIPSSYVITLMRQCYDFFVLHFGPWNEFPDHRKLTDCLNEVLVAFWSELHLMPQYLEYKGFLSSWPQGYKIADFANSNGEDNELSWESDLKQQVLLDETSFLGLKDVLVYNLPKPALEKGYRSYGLVRNFASDCDSLPQVSNWIEHMDTIYTRLSSHVIAGNVQYKEAVEDEGPGESGNEPSTTGESIMNHGKKLYHNFTLPITFAYDAVQEVGNMAGVSSSMSLLTDFIPSIPSWNPWASSDKRTKEARSEFLISPLSASFLPDSYKIKRLRLSFGKKFKEYNCLFWFYNEILAILVFEQDFNKIWDHEYLNDLHFKLTNCISKLSSEIISTTPRDMENFCFATISKRTHQIRSSFPPYKAQKVPDSASPLELVVNGLDEFLSNTNRKTSIATINPLPSHADTGDPATQKFWGLSLMGGMFKKDSTSTNPKNKSATFLDTIPEDKLRYLHLDISKFAETVRASKKASDLSEEKLIKLNNGVLCFIREDADETVIVAENWFDKKTARSGTLANSSSLIRYMGKDAVNWWRDRGRVEVN